MLAPPYQSVVSIHGGHLLFVSGEGDTRYAVSLHAWEPFRQTERTLEAVVDSMP